MQVNDTNISDAKQRIWCKREQWGEIIMVNVVRSIKALKSELYLRFRFLRHGKHSPSRL